MINDVQVDSTPTMEMRVIYKDGRDEHYTNVHKCIHIPEKYTMQIHTSVMMYAVDPSEVLFIQHWVV